MVWLNLQGGVIWVWGRPEPWLWAWLSTITMLLTSNGGYMVCVKIEVGDVGFDSFLFDKGWYGILWLSEKVEENGDGENVDVEDKKNSDDDVDVEDKNDDENEGDDDVEKDDGFDKRLAIVVLRVTFVKFELMLILGVEVEIVPNSVWWLEKRQQLPV